MVRISSAERASPDRIPLIRAAIRAVAAAVVLFLPAVSAPATAVETSAPRAMIVETDSGSVLYGKGLDETFAPGNFTKLLTAAVVYDALAKGEVSDDTLYPVSEHAWRTGGAPARVTTMFAAVKSRVAVGDLLRGLVVHYANDAAIVLAEGLSGSEAAFADRMNAYAASIGMARSHFANPTGYAERGAVTTIDDLRILIDHIRTRFPQRYSVYALPQFEWNGILQRNKTSYVNTMPGVEGLVLAYDEAAGFGAAVSAVRDGRRVLVIASGFSRDRDRDDAVETLLDAAYTEFTRVTLFEPGAEVGTIRVFGGSSTRVPVEGEGPVAVTLPKGERDEFRLAIVYDGPVPAPVSRGNRVAALEVRQGDRVYQSIPLVAAADVPVGDMLERARDGLLELLLGWW